MRISDWSSDVCSSDLVPFLYEIRAFWEDAAVGNGTGTEGSLRYRLTRLLESHAVRAADAVAVICGGLKQDLLARGVAEDKIIVSPNGVDMDMFGAPVPPDSRLRTQLGLDGANVIGFRSEEHTSELQSLMRSSYAVFCLKK